MFDDPHTGLSSDAEDASEQLVIVAERAAGTHKLEYQPIADEIRAAIAVRHGVTVRDLLLVSAGAIPGPPAARSAAARAGPPTSTAVCAVASLRRRPSPPNRTENSKAMTDFEEEVEPQRPGHRQKLHPLQKTDMTVPEMRQWLREWVGKAVGKSPDSIDESVPMVELGLASRDAVAMAADIEDMTGVTLSVAVAFQHPTIESLATRIIEGEPERLEER